MSSLLPAVLMLMGLVSFPLEPPELDFFVVEELPELDFSIADELLSCVLAVVSVLAGLLSVSVSLRVSSIIGSVLVSPPKSSLWRS